MFHIFLKNGNREKQPASYFPKEKRKEKASLVILLTSNLNLKSRVILEQIDPTDGARSCTYLHLVRLNDERISL